MQLGFIQWGTGSEQRAKTHCKWHHKPSGSSRWFPALPLDHFTQYLPSEHSADTGGDTSVQELVSDEKPSEICTSKQETDYTKLW